MADVTLKQIDGQTRSLSTETVDGLRAAVRGQVALPGEEGYEEARGIWNAMNVPRPGLVVRCAGPNDVLQAVRLAKENRLLVSVRGGGAQHRRECGLRGRLDDRPLADEVGACRSGGTARLGRAGRDAGRPRP